ncbi:MAG: response regulator [Nitrospirae bacterium]|nr:MAG: response regulator [Nitrospirota bacterium]
MTPVVLFVDDEPGVLSAVRRIFLEDKIELVTADSGAEGISVLREREVAVIVSDNMMPGMNGIQFLEQAKLLAPDTIRILMTGYADVQSAMDAINRGGVYRFLTKPWDNDNLRRTVLDGVREHGIVSALRSADEAKLLSLAQTIELKDHYTRGHCENVARYALAIAAAAGLAGDDLKDIKYASWLHDCGKIGVPEEVLNYPGRLTEDMMRIVRKHSEWGADVAGKAALPDVVVKAILHHHEKYDGSGYPHGISGETIPLGARILAIADVYDAVTTDRPYRKAMQKKDALNIICEGRSTWFDPALADYFIAWIGGSCDQ